MSNKNNEQHWYYIQFQLKYPVIDLEAARTYLTEDDMTKYLKEDTRIPESARDKVEHIEWKLQVEDHGVVEVITNDTLTDEENNKITSFISVQNSDGLGESMEQSDFAYYDINDPYNERKFPEDDDYEEDCMVMASFLPFDPDELMYEVK